MNSAVDMFLVGAIVGAAVFVTVRKLVRDAGGKSTCNCGSACGCDSAGKAVCHEQKPLHD